MKNMKISNRLGQKNKHSPQSIITIPVEIANKYREKGIEYLALLYNDTTGILECHPRTKLYE